jgi:hypothetical protein
MKINSLKDLHELGVSYWRACALHTAVKLRVFTHLGPYSMDADELAERMQTEPRATGLLLNAVTALGLVKKTGDKYANTPFSRQHLDEEGPNFMGNIIYHYLHMYADWGLLAEAVRTGKSVVRREDRDEESVKQFLLGMHNLAVRGAEVLAHRLDLSGRKHMLDLGGGPGTYSLYFCRSNPKLSAVIFDLPDTEPIAAKKIASFELTDRVRFHPGNFHNDPLPPGPFDLVFMSHILHGASTTQCAELFQKVFPVVSPGGEVIIQEFVLNEDKTEPTFAAMFSLNMLLHTPRGRSFSLDEISTWLEDAGFTKATPYHCDLPNDASLVRALKPSS